MNRLARVDLPLLLVMLALSALGLVMIYSATELDSSRGSELMRQLRTLGLGALLYVFFARVDYHVWGRWHWLGYLGGLGAVVAVLFVGITAKGATRWLDLGPLGTFQPSEPLKLLVMVSLARVLSRAHDEGRSEARPPFWLPLVMLGVPVLAIMAQPDLGTALVLIGLTLILLYLAGIPLAWLLALIVAGLLVLPNVLHDYQRERILVFLDPERDPTGSGWNLIQARLAVGSGQLWGTGVFEGVQKRLHFVPEQHTDFIFTVVGEELGLVGGLVLLALYLYLVLQSLRTAARAPDRFGGLLAAGVGCLLGLHVVINIGMVIGLMPITGLPLPFLSYGGSALLTTMAALGLLTSVWIRRRIRPLGAGIKPDPLYASEAEGRTVLKFE